jgi:UDP-N-acetylglucosamine 2-epimerase (non-hydrolysing)
VLSIVGTRPEAIKIAPIALAARRRPHLRHRILATGQQNALFDDALDGFGLAPDRRLPPVLHDRDPDVLTGRLDAAIRPVLAAAPPDMVLVQGDTTSAYAAAIAAHALGIPVAHIEAGLRSHDRAALARRTQSRHDRPTRDLAVPADRGCQGQSARRA